MEDFKNIVSFVWVAFTASITWVDHLEQWTRIAAGLISIVVGVVTLHRIYKKKKNEQ